MVFLEYLHLEEKPQFKKKNIIITIDQQPSTYLSEFGNTQNTSIFNISINFFFYIYFTQ